jgi:hypothetical protein
MRDVPASARDEPQQRALPAPAHEAIEPASSTATTSPAAADREECAVLEFPIAAPGLTVTEAIVDDEALDVLERGVLARRLAADAMRRARSRLDDRRARRPQRQRRLSSEAFFESMAAVSDSARTIACPAGTRFTPS